MKHLNKLSSKKLVEQTYDGDAMQPGHVFELQSLVKEKYPSATFIHYYNHKLNLAKRNVKIYRFYNRMKTVFNSLFEISSFFFFFFAFYCPYKCCKSFYSRKITRYNTDQMNLFIQTCIHCRRIQISYYQVLFTKI